MKAEQREGEDVKEVVAVVVFARDRDRDEAVFINYLVRYNKSKRGQVNFFPSPLLCETIHAKDSKGVVF